ncbi:hypothetical protein [Mycobacterium sp. HUMS_1102779]|uniref:hypothetical protein n=1 Tax=Mycobacterium sp. HUMS_1102779 TaxID=3383487 RepID=UPI00389A1402
MISDSVLAASGDGDAGGFLVDGVEDFAASAAVNAHTALAAFQPPVLPEPIRDSRVGLDFSWWVGCSREVC